MIICSECGKEIGEEELCYITYVNPENQEAQIYACEDCNKKVCTAS